MASWNIEGSLGLKTSQFEAGINRAKKEAAELKKEVEKNAKEASKALGEIGKEVGLGDIGKLLGFGGATVAAASFAGAIAEALKGVLDLGKEGSKAFGNFESTALRLGTITKGDGSAIAEFIESLPAGAGTFDELAKAFMNFSEAGLNIDESSEKLQQFQKIAKGTGKDIVALSENYRKWQAGGADQGEAGAKLLKGAPWLQQQLDEQKQSTLNDLIRPDRTKLYQFGKTFQEDIPAGIGRDGIFHPDHREARTIGVDWLGKVPDEGGIAPKSGGKSNALVAEINKINNQSDVDYLKSGNFRSEDMEAILKRSTGPGGQYGNVMKQSAGTQETKQAQIALEWEKLMVELGEKMSGPFKKALNDIIEELPRLTPMFDSLGTEIGKLIDFIDAAAKTADKGLKQVSPINDAMGGKLAQTAAGFVAMGNPTLAPLGAQMASSGIGEFIKTVLSENKGNSAQGENMRELQAHSKYLSGIYDTLDRTFGGN